MRSPCCLCVCVYPQSLKAGIVEAEETAAARQRLGKHLPAATNTHVTIEELLDAEFSMRFMSYQILFV
jgi:hypothetical protein